MSSKTVGSRTEAFSAIKHHIPTIHLYTCPASLPPLPVPRPALKWGWDFSLVKSQKSISWQQLLMNCRASPLVPGFGHNNPFSTFSTPLKLLPPSTFLIISPAIWKLFQPISFFSHLILLFPLLIPDLKSTEITAREVSFFGALRPSYISSNETLFASVIVS